MGRPKKSEIIVERDKIIEHLESKPLTKSDIKEIEKETKPKREMTEKQKAHIANLVQKNRERFQRVAEENKQKKEQIKQEKEELIKKKLESGELVKIPVPPKRKYVKKEKAYGEYHAHSTEESSDEEPEVDPYTEEETEEDTEPEYVPPPKPKKQRAPRRKKVVVESDSSDYTDTSEDEIKPKKIQKMKKTLEKIDETLSKAQQPVNPYLALLNRRFNK